MDLHVHLAGLSAQELDELRRYEEKLSKQHGRQIALVAYRIEKPAHDEGSGGDTTPTTNGEA